MSNLRHFGKWISVQSSKGGRKTTDHGIIYDEVVRSRYIWATVVAIGDSLTEDICVKDRILWDRSQFKGQGYGEFDLIHQDWIALTER